MSLSSDISVHARVIIRPDAGVAGSEYVGIALETEYANGKGIHKRDSGVRRAQENLLLDFVSLLVLFVFGCAEAYQSCQRTR